MKVSGIMYLFVFHFLLAIMAAPSSPTVIIVGAGMSGIVAAKTLHDAGIRDILILEANPWIGGRIHKGQIGGHTIEMGANWLYDGAGSNVLNKIAKKLKLRSFFSDYKNLSSNTYKQEDGLYPKHIVDAALNVAEAKDKFCTHLSNELSSKAGKDDDVSILTAQRMYKQVPRTPLEMVIDYFYNDYEDAEPPSVTSLKTTFPRHKLGDYNNTYFVADPRGFESIVHYIAKLFLSHDHDLITDPRLRLNKVVRRIDYSNDGVTVKTEDGSVYRAKYAIVSVSIGVLQSNLIKFKPDFPLSKTLAIYNFDMTIYTKIFLKFPYKFWPTGPGTEFFLYAHERRGYYPIWQHLDDEIPGSNILMTQVTDEESRRIEQQSDEKTKAEVMDVLRKMFGDRIPEPEAILVLKWWSNRFFRGCFSNWPAGYSQKRYKELRESVGPIYFAGEHTDSKYFGYVHGAYLAGVGTAKEVIKSLTIQSSS